MGARIMQDSRDGFIFDNLGRIKYHPDFHENHGQKFTEDDLCYLAKFYKHDGRRAMSFALGKTEVVIQNKYFDLVKSGLIEHYKNMNHYI